MATFPAISLWQPWASLLFAPDAKVHETRHWPFPERLLGQRVLIHAAMHPIGEFDLDPRLFRLCTARYGEGWRRARRLPFGAFVGFVTLGACLRIEAEDQAANDNDALCGDWTPGRFAWRMDERTAFAKPIPATGYRQCWTAEIGEAA